MDAIQPVAAVVLVLALLCGALFLLKNRGAARFRLPGISSGPRRMEVLERVALGPHHALHLVRLAERTMVVATSPSSCQVLGDPAMPPEWKNQL